MLPINCPASLTIVSRLYPCGAVVHRAFVFIVPSSTHVTTAAPKNHSLPFSALCSVTTSVLLMHSSSPMSVVLTLLYLLLECTLLLFGQTSSPTLAQARGSTGLSLAVRGGYFGFAAESWCVASVNVDTMGFALNLPPATELTVLLCSTRRYRSRVTDYLHFRHRHPRCRECWLALEEIGRAPVFRLAQATVGATWRRRGGRSSHSPTFSGICFHFQYVFSHVDMLLYDVRNTYVNLMRKGVTGKQCRAGVGRMTTNFKDLMHEKATEFHA